MTTSSNSRVFLLLFLATLAAFGPFVTDFYLPTLPEQTTDFHTSPAMVQLGLSNIMWGLAAGQLLVGPISDRRGRKKPLFGVWFFLPSRQQWLQLPLKYMFFSSCVSLKASEQPAQSYFHAPLPQTATQGESLEALWA